MTDVTVVNLSDMTLSQKVRTRETPSCPHNIVLRSSLRCKNGTVHFFGRHVFKFWSTCQEAGCRCGERLRTTTGGFARFKVYTHYVDRGKGLPTER